METGTEQFQTKVLVVMEQIKEEIKEVKEQLKRLNGTVRDNCTDIAVLKDWRQTQVQPTLSQVPDVRLDLRELAVKYSGTVAIIGGVTTVILVALKALGVF